MGFGKCIPWLLCRPWRFPTKLGSSHVPCHTQMGVSWNGGSPKSGWLGGTPHFRKPPNPYHWHPLNSDMTRRNLLAFHHDVRFPIREVAVRVHWERHAREPRQEPSSTGKYGRRWRPWLWAVIIWSKDKQTSGSLSSKVGILRWSAAAAILLVMVHHERTVALLANN